MSDIQMGAWEQPAPVAGAAAGRGEGGAGRMSGAVSGLWTCLVLGERKKKVARGLWVFLS